MAGLRVFVFLEFCIAVLLGVIPLAIAYGNDEAVGLDLMVRSLLPGEILINYFFYFMVGAFAVGAIGYYALRRNEAQRLAWGAFFYVFCEVGGGAINILRVGSGVMLGFPLVWVVVEPETFEITRVLHFLFFGVLAFVEAAFLQGVMLLLKSLRKPLEFKLK